ncbi:MULTISPECIES: DUF3027 domain-containing protein [Bacteria]|uniref:DUF3027 domain-containing protein n=1 Tax=Bacteria TaxID=2 RepID=UPI003C7E1EA5
MTSTPDADQRLLDARDLALAALHEITPAATIGPAAGYLVEEDGTVSLRFENRLPGYPGWYWTVTVARVDDEEPTVLEAELLPGDGALLAPEWVPWAERLAEYRAHQAELAAHDRDEDGDAAGEGDPGDQDDLDEADEVDGADEGGFDEVDLDEDDLDEDLLHSGDLDGVDIDELDDSATGSEDEEAVAKTGESEPDEAGDTPTA